ncbi:MAG: ParB/RepB/Spo0J family partition protein [Clostridia bacterium]|nr:ParB/RepB/Spo0J family partition protein [Clostridia bacterium]
MVRIPQKIKMVSISEIIPNPYQIRRKFERKKLQSLSDSLRQVGMLSPVILRGGRCGYEIICGQRRVRAAQMAGFKEIPAIILSAGDLQCAQISMIENLQRENLSLCEEAEGYYNLMSYHRVKKDRLSLALSEDSEEISEKIRLLSMGEKVRYKIEENNIPKETVKELLKLHSDRKQLEIIEKIKTEELRHSEVCEIVKQILLENINCKNDEKPQKRRKTFTPSNLLYLNTVKKTVEILKNNGAKVELTQTETEKSLEFVVKIAK